MADKIKIVLKDGTSKVVEVVNENLTETYDRNNINQDEVVGIDKVGE